MTDYTDKLADAMGEGFDADAARRYACSSFALGLLLLGIEDEDEEETQTTEEP